MAVLLLGLEKERPYWTEQRGGEQTAGGHSHPSISESPSGCTNVLTHDSTFPQTGAMQIRSSLLKPISRRAEEAAPSAVYSFRLPRGEA